MTWQCREPGHQQPWYCSRSPGIFWCEDHKGQFIEAWRNCLSFGNKNYSYILWVKCLNGCWCQSCRDHSGYGLSQWEEALLRNTFSHWLSPYPEWSLVWQSSVQPLNTKLLQIISFLFLSMKYVFEVITGHSTEDKSASIDFHLHRCLLNCYTILAWWPWDCQWDIRQGLWFNWQIFLSVCVICL